MNPFDLVLLAVVCTQTLILAYTHSARVKAFILCLPFPFTSAVLALGRPVDGTNVSGLFFLLIFAHGVRILYLRLKCPIVAAIVISALLYCGLAAANGAWMPNNDTSFWICAAIVMTTGALMLLLAPRIDEPGYRTTLPIYLKLPAIAAIIVLLLLAKNILQGAMTVFPMVGVFAAYETRNSLWTTCNAIAVLMLTMTPMMIVCRLAAPWGLGWSLAAGWVVLLSTLIPLTVIGNRQRK
jgi:hypothetical protein